MSKDVVKQNENVKDVVDGEVVETESVPKESVLTKAKAYVKDHGLVIGALAGAAATLGAIIGYNVIAKDDVIDGEFTEEDAE